MSRRKPPRISNDSPAASYCEKTAQMALCFQILATALYYNGWILPLMHKILLGQFLAVTAWFCYLLHSLFARRFVLACSPYYLPTGILCVWAGFRAFTAPNQDAVHNYYIFFTILSTFPLWVTYFRKRYFVNLFLWTVLITGVLMTVGCLRQLSMTNPRFDWSFFEASTLSPGSYDRQNLGSFMGHNNDSTSYIALSAIVAGLLWKLYRGRVQWAPLFLVYILVALVMIYLGGSRGVALMTLSAVTVLVLAFFAWRIGFKTRIAEHPNSILPKRWGGWGIGLSAAAVVFFILLLKLAPIKEKGYENVFSRFMTSQDTLISGTYPRVWTMSLLMARTNPILGVGFSSWPFEYPFYQEKWFTRYPQTPIGLPEVGKHTMRGHNDYLQLWAELGIVGLALMLWLLFVHAKCFWLILKKRFSSPIALFAYTATIASLAQAIFGFPFHLAAGSCLFLGNLALVSSRLDRQVWRWEPVWMKQPWSQGRGGAMLGIAALFVLLYYPITQFVLGEHISQNYWNCGKWAGMYPDKAQAYLDQGYQRLGHSFKYQPNHGKNLYTYGIDTFNHGAIAQDKEMILEGIDLIKRSQGNYSFYGSYSHIGEAYYRLWKLDPKPETIEEAIKNYEKAASIMPIDEENWLQLVLLYSDNGQLEKRLNVLGGTEIRFPGFVERKFPDAAFAAESRGEIETAANLYALAALVKPESEEIFKAMNLFYMRIDRLDMQASILVQLAKHQPPQSFNYWMLSILTAQLQTERSHEARSMMANLFQIQEIRDYPELWYYSGLVSWIAGHPWEAVLYWTNALDHEVTLDLVEPPLSLILDQIYQPAVIR